MWIICTTTADGRKIPENPRFCQKLPKCGKMKILHPAGKMWIPGGIENFCKVFGKFFQNNFLTPSGKIVGVGDIKKFHFENWRKFMNNFKDNSTKDTDDFQKIGQIYNEELKKVDKQTFWWYVGQEIIVFATASIITNTYIRYGIKDWFMYFITFVLIVVMNNFAFRHGLITGKRNSEALVRAKSRVDNEIIDMVTKDFIQKSLEERKKLQHRFTIFGYKDKLYCAKEVGGHIIVYEKDGTRIVNPDGELLEVARLAIENS